VSEQTESGPGATQVGAALVRLYVTQEAGAGDVGALGADAAAVVASVFARAGVRERAPFVLGAGGCYDTALNRFFRELDSWGVRAANSIAAYARDVMLFCRFLHESRGGKSIWACDGADLRAYKQVRLRTPGDGQVSVATWRRSIAALDKWAAWAVYEGLLERAPFRYVDRTAWTPQGVKRVRVNAESEPDPGRGPIRFVGFEDYLLWRDVGLRGRLPDGRVDPSWRGRHDQRNALFADLLIHTGMRLGEAACLLVCEVPGEGGAAERRAGTIRLGPAVTKRGRARAVFVPIRLVRALNRYVRIERGELVSRVAVGGGYAEAGDMVLVRRAGPVDATFAGGGSLPYGRIDAGTRRRMLLLTPDGEVSGPLPVWLGTDGHSVASSTWQSVFARANARCRRFDLDLRVSPHTLRHCFAVHMLGLLLRQTVIALGEDPGRNVTSAQVKRLLVGNPLRTLQRLLGHASEATVYAYLDVLDEAQEIVATALGRWDADAARLSAVCGEAGARRGQPGTGPGVVAAAGGVGT